MSDDTPAVPPALTRDDMGRIAVVHGRNGGAFVEPHNPDEVAIAMEHGRRVVYFSGEARRALGALALDGYFTREQFDALDYLVDYAISELSCYEVNNSDAENAEAAARAALARQALAALRALLPPV